MESDEILKRKRLEAFVAGELNISTAAVEREENGYFEIGNWENVTGHCLLEAARACVFADILGFDSSLKKDFATAALLHDGNKRKEIEAIQEDLKNGGSGREASNKATREYLAELAGKGMAHRIVKIIGFSGGMPEVLVACKNILDQKMMSDENVAALLMYYIDAYTRNDLWADPVGAVGGVLINDADRRAEKNKRNTNYAKMNEEIVGILNGYPFFAGLTCFEAMPLVAHEIEKKLSALIRERSGVEIEPLAMPEAVDSRLRNAGEK